jgi:hypothetical protein
VFGVEAAVARMLPPLPTVRRDGWRAVLREHQARRTRSLLDGWAVLTATMTMPPAAAARFTDRFPEVDAERVGAVWDTFLQWVRIEGRHYPSRHVMPSRSVDAFIRMLRSDPSDWIAALEGWPVYVGYLFEKPLRLWMPGDSLPPLQVTWSDAFNDEPPKSKTPLLFRVDADIGLRDARTFQGFCKGGKCAPPADVTCLHLTKYTDPSPEVHDFI